MNRALLWLLGGLVAFVVVLVLIAPELLGNPRFLGGSMGVTLAAAVPALLVMSIFAASRRGRRIRGEERRREQRRGDDQTPLDQERT